MSDNIHIEITRRLIDFATKNLAAKELAIAETFIQAGPTQEGILERIQIEKSRGWKDAMIVKLVTEAFKSSMLLCVISNPMAREIQPYPIQFTASETGFLRHVLTLAGEQMIDLGVAAPLDMLEDLMAKLVHAERNTPRFEQAEQDMATFISVSKDREA